MKKLKFLGISFIVIFFIGVAGYNYVMYGGARNLAEEKTDFTVASKSILDEFSVNTEASNKKYLEKAVVVTGIVTLIIPKGIVLDEHVICNLTNPAVSAIIGKAVYLKGRIVGYDDLMTDLQLDKCFIIIK